MKPTLLDPKEGAHLNLAIHILSPDDERHSALKMLFLTTMKQSKCPKYSLFNNFCSLSKMGQYLGSFTNTHTLHVLHFKNISHQYRWH
jgi:hypothetical protein